MKRIYSLFAGCLMLALPAADAGAASPFDIAGLCKWQLENNGMNIDECTALEEEGKAYVAANEAQTTAERREECQREVESYAGDSGFASYTVYAACLKDGPGAL